MFQRIENSWNLVKASWAVLRADKELIVFPIVSMIAATLVTLTFFVPMMFVFFASDSPNRGALADPAFFVFLLIFYIVQYTVVFFCNTALVGAAMIRLNGGDPTVGDGFRIARERVGKIVAYAVIASTVGMVLRWLSERGLLGRIVAGFFGLAWNIATYLVVPVLVVEDIGPVDAIKRSTALLRKTWGEQIVGNVGIGAVFGLLIFALVLLFIPALLFVITLQSVVLIIGAILFFVLVLIGLGLLSSALGGIYTAAVYRFAVNGDPGEFFDKSLVEQTFRAK